MQRKQLAMTRSRLAFVDQKLIELHSQYLQVRRSLGELFRGVNYHDFVDNGRYYPNAMPAVMVASEHLLAVANSVSRFCYELHALASWQKALEALGEDERTIALFEFVSPMATSCLSLPYSIRQMLVKSICHISHHTNRLCVADWDEAALKPDRERVSRIRDSHNKSRYGL
jgi:hypothetical protein